jgi:hypothetical protein
MTDTSPYGNPEEVGNWYEYMSCRGHRGFDKHRFPKAAASDGRLKAMANLYLRNIFPSDPMEAQILHDMSLSTNCLPPNDLKRYSKLLADLINQKAAK